jgi:hypothetical protein
MNDISLATNPDGREDGILLAFAIDDVIVHIMGTFVWFYDLITSGHEVVEVPSEEGTFVVSFMDSEEVVETLDCSELLSALLRSEPRVIVLVREPKPPIESIGIRRYVAPGWRVDENEELIPPSDWVDPRTLSTLEPTEEQKEALKQLGHQI